MNSLTIGAKTDSLYLDQPHAKAWGYMNSLTIGAKADSLYLDQPHAKAWGYMNSLTIGLKPIHFISINPMLKHGVI
jgi:hypothetical protein